MNWYLFTGLSIICLVTIFGVPPLVRYFMLFGNEADASVRDEINRALAKATVFLLILYVIGILVASIRG